MSEAPTLRRAHGRVRKTATDSSHRTPGSSDMNERSGRRVDG